MTPQALDQWRWEQTSNCMSPLDAIESYRRLVREDVRPDKGVATTDTLTPQGADGRQAPMTEPLEDEAMSIIRRAAVLLKERGDGCCTPGAHYETNLSLPNEMSIKVTLSEEQSARLQEQIEKHPYRVPYMDNVLHDYFQVAVAKILAGDVI